MSIILSPQCSCSAAIQRASKRVFDKRSSKAVVKGVVKCSICKVKCEITLSPPGQRFAVSVGRRQRLHMEAARLLAD